MIRTQGSRSFHRGDIMTYNPNSGFTFEDYLKFGAALGFVFLFIFGPAGLLLVPVLLLWFFIDEMRNRN
jgi:hypothetical protein